MAEYYYEREAETDDATPHDLFSFLENLDDAN